MKASEYKAFKGIRKESIEKETGASVISKTNSLNYQYTDESKQITEDKNKVTN